ncbi:hypothetical protein J6590_085322 [Homalodisca vitripennis]|nr:hypothetical protein J6590_085322 [Homalodisca vitripennis]
MAWFFEKSLLFKVTDQSGYVNKIPQDDAYRADLHSHPEKYAAKYLTLRFVLPNLKGILADSYDTHTLLRSNP